MKMIFFIMGILISQMGCAETFKIAGSLTHFEEKEGLLLKGCKQESCEALKAIKKHKKIDMKKIRKGMSFANSVGSDVCARVYKRDSLLGVDKNQDGRAFCLFKDKSMVEMNSLTSYLIKKRIVTE